MVVIAVVVDVVVAERLFDDTEDSDGVWVAAATWIGIQLVNVGIVAAVVGCCVDVSSKNILIIL